MKKLLFALTILIMVTIPAALAANVTAYDADKTKASPSSVTDNDIETAFAGVAIDLDNEKLLNPNTKSIDGWSTNGTSWKQGVPADKDIQKFLDKGGNLYLIQGLNAKKKPDAEAGYKIFAFTAFDKRPKANPDKLKPLYTDTTWGLSKDGTTLCASGTSYVFVAADSSTGKVPDGAEWTTTFSNAMTVAPVPEKGAKKATYYFKVPANATAAKPVAGSKPWKVTPATLGKAPKLKVDYKKEVIKLKAGTNFEGTKLAAATTTSVASYLDSGKTEVVIYIAATGKKPATAPQTLKLASRAAAPSGTLTVEKGKIKDPNLKNYEFSSDGKTWVKAPPVSSSNLTCKARLKANAKWKDDSFGDTRAAGAEGTLTITWGDWDTEKEGTQAGIMTASFGS